MGTHPEMRWKWPACAFFPYPNLRCYALMMLICLVREFHREQLSIENSMRDLDSAVGRLDNILMSVYVIVAALIIAVALVCYLILPFHHPHRLIV
jgi:hypothetical protein